MKEFRINFCLSDSEYLTALRLAVGAVCSAADVDVDAAEDMKVCVTESCIILKGCGCENAEVVLKTEGGVSAVVEGFGGAPVACDNEFSLALVSALVSSLDIERRGEAINKLTLVL